MRLKWQKSYDIEDKKIKMTKIKNNRVKLIIKPFFYMKSEICSSELEQNLETG